jgi:hypothetical protein
MSDTEGAAVHANTAAELSQLVALAADVARRTRRPLLQLARLIAPIELAARSQTTLPTFATDDTFQALRRVLSTEPVVADELTARRRAVATTIGASRERPAQISSNSMAAETRADRGGMSAAHGVAPARRLPMASTSAATISSTTASSAPPRVERLRDEPAAGEAKRGSAHGPTNAIDQTTGTTGRARSSRISVAEQRRQLRERRESSGSMPSPRIERSGEGVAAPAQSAIMKASVLTALLAPAREAVSEARLTAASAKALPERHPAQGVAMERSALGAAPEMLTAVRAGPQGQETSRSLDRMQRPIDAPPLARMPVALQSDELFEDAYRHGVDLT